MRTNDYLSGAEDLRPRELVWGVVREPPSPFAQHQRLTTRIASLLDQHVRQHDLGTVLVAPMDVVLDPEKDLVLQPDVMFISRARENIIQDFVRGAPDLVVEVTSPGTARSDRRDKVRWYQASGVRECWLVDAQQQTVTVYDLSSDAAGVGVSNDAVVRSSVLPLLSLAAGELLMTS
jgi:Uma2 family endonuclease